MNKKIYDSVLGRLAVEVPLFAETMLNNALKNIGATPSDVTPFQMKTAITTYIEPMLEKTLGQNRGIKEIGSGIIHIDKKGKILNASPSVYRLLPDLEKRKFIAKSNLVANII
ncbi:MAG: hypothetical protein KKC05_01975, partial [Nanoarchaeota archaeon]|nr:hypothetical protein [Nanoarchaeota archaeon]